MPENFKLVKKTSENQCDAMRCKNEPIETMDSGVKLCGAHLKLLTAADIDRGAIDVAPTAALATTEEGLKNQALAAHAEAERTQRETKAAQTEAENLLSNLGEYKIKTQEDSEMVAGVLNEVHEKIKALETQRKTATQPLTQAKKAINSWFAPPRDALQAVKSLLKDKIAAYYSEQAEARQAALNTGDVKTALATPDAEVPSGVGTRSRVAYTITDLLAVPRKYLKLDETALREAIKGRAASDLVIPGIIFRDEIQIIAGKGK